MQQQEDFYFKQLILDHTSFIPQSYHQHHHFTPSSPPLLPRKDSVLSKLDSYVSNHKVLGGTLFLLGLNGFVFLNKQSQYQKSDIDLIDRQVFNSNNSYNLDTFFQQSKDESFLFKKLNDQVEKLFNTTKIFQYPNLQQFQNQNCIENLMFLENRNQPTFISQHFLPGYKKLLQKVQKHKKKEKQFCPMSLVKMYTNFSLEIMKKLYYFTMGCTSEHCFQLMKKVNKTSIEQQKTQFQITLEQQSKHKKKPWSQIEIQQIRSLIQTNHINHQKIKLLSNTFNRSVASVQSKIQKLKKSLQPQNSSNNKSLPLNKIVITALQYFPQGATKQTILQKIQELFFKQNNDEKWRKSISVILSSANNIERIKVKYFLKVFNQKYNEKSLKGRVITCLKQLNNKPSQIRQIVQKYLQLYSVRQMIKSNDAEKRKSIENNIMRTIQKYQDFQKTQNKTIYRLFQPNIQQQL